MKVNELKDKTQVDEMVLKITKQEETRDVRGGSLKVCNFTGEDDTGSIVVALWNDDIDKVKEGDTIKISKGWCQEYDDKLQVSPGRFGTLEVVED